MYFSSVVVIVCGPQPRDAAERERVTIIHGAHIRAPDKICEERTTSCTSISIYRRVKRQRDDDSTNICFSSTVEDDDKFHLYVIAAMA